jgi:hypothetical protein
MSDTRQALGQDPLEWIKDTKEEGKPSILRKQNKLGLHSKPKTKRQTYHLKVEIIEKVRGYAYWERLGVSEVVNIALEEFFKDKEIEEHT